MSEDTRCIKNKDEENTILLFKENRRARMPKGRKGGAPRRPIGARSFARKLGKMEKGGKEKGRKKKTEKRTRLIVPREIGSAPRSAFDVRFSFAYFLYSSLISPVSLSLSLSLSLKNHRRFIPSYRSIRGKHPTSSYILRFSKSVRVLLILLNTGNLVSVLGDSGDGVLGAMSSDPRGLQTLLRGLGLCLASRPKSWPKLNGVFERLAQVAVCWFVSSLKKFTIEFVGDWLKLEDGDTESAALPREKVGLRLSGFVFDAPITELTRLIWW